MEQIKFLIVIAYYDRPEIVKNALQSICELQYDNFEVAFIDDGSNTPGKPIVESIFNNQLLSKTKIYRCDDTIEQKISQGGSRFGEYINTAIKESNAEYFILVCDDDAVLPDYFKNLNTFLQEKRLPYCFSKARFYSPDVETFRSHRENPERHFSGSQYNINYGHAVNPYGTLDNCQLICNTECFKKGIVSYPFPQTRNLDMHLYGQLVGAYGLCHPTNIYGQIKGAFAGQLGSTHTPY